MPMPMRDCNSRVNATELRLVISERLGPERARRYFSCLERFLSRKLGKSEFDKVCHIALGEENIALHNQLIRAILRNAHQSKSPPLPPRGKDASHQHPASSMGGATTWSNGELPPPRRCRSGARGRRYKDKDKDKDKPSPLGPGWRSSSFPHQFPEDVGTKEDDALVGVDEMPSKRQRIGKQSEVDHLLVDSYPAGRDNKEEGLPMQDAYPTKPLVAPLGIPHHVPSPHGYRRCLASDDESTTSMSTSHSAGALHHSVDLKRRMDCIAKAQGLGEVSLDSANLLNKGLDSYLKRIIESCVQLSGSRSRSEPMRNPINKQLPHSKTINGMRQGNHHVQLPGRSTTSEGPSERRSMHSISLQDFNVAVQLNPQQVGRDWPVLLEKIRAHSFDE